MVGGARPVAEQRWEEDDVKRVIRRTVAFLASDDGPTASEYAIMLALIVVVAMAAVQTLGSNVNSTFQNINTNITGS
jgi:pilus assembly protein Flp/PilA